MWNQKQFEDIYARYQSSGLHVKEFCRNESIITSRFYYWQRKLRKQEVQPGETRGFVPVIFTGHEGQPAGNILPRQSPALPTLTGGNALEIVYPGGVTVRVPAGSDISLLRSLILLTR